LILLLLLLINIKDYYDEDYRQVGKECLKKERRLSSSDLKQNKSKDYNNIIRRRISKLKKP
jgi:hypothetical protein